MTFGAIQIIRPAANVSVAALGPRGFTGTPGADGEAGVAGPPNFYPVAPWATATQYLSGPPAHLVTIGGSAYVCAGAHISNNFATDFASGYWNLLVSVGQNGSTWYSGNGVPSSSIGVNGDFYLQIDSDDIFNKVSGSWGSPLLNIKGATGAPGSNGSAIRTGSGIPSNSLGVDGDSYIDTANLRFYGPKASGAWPSSYTSMIGPTGSGAGNVLGPTTGSTKPGQMVVFGADETHIIGAGHTTRGDAAYTILATDNTVALTTALTAPRTWTLPVASTLAAGAEILFVDEVAAGGISATNTLTIARAGSDLINNATSAVLASANAFLVLMSDGVSKWTIVDGTPTAANTVGLGNVATRSIGTTAGTVPDGADSRFPPSIFLVKGVVAKTSAYTILPTDVATEFDLTGSFALTLPAASVATASAPLWFHVRKRDGSGRCTLVCAGSDTIEGGFALIAVYQEKFTVYSFGAGWYLYNRQRSVIVQPPIGFSGSSALAFTAGFDSDVQDVEFEFYKTVVGTSAAAILAQLYQSGAYVTTGYVAEGFDLESGNSGGINEVTGGGTALPLSGGSQRNTSTIMLSASLRNIQSTTAGAIVLKADGSGTDTGGSSSAFRSAWTARGYSGTAALCAGIKIYPASGTFSGLYSQRIYRP